MRLSRRSMLKATALAAGGLLLELGFDGRMRLVTRALADAAPAPAGFRPYAWIAIEPDGRTIITVGRMEMGQGPRTALPMIIAEELDADWDRLEAVTAMPGPGFRGIRTSGSWSVGGSWQPLRQMGARARAVLIAAAAARWNVAASECDTVPGRVRHAASGRTLGYGELAIEAAKLPLPDHATLKDPKSFRLIGTRMKRRDAPAIVTGGARYGIDVRVPGMKFASVERGPVPGSRAVTVDDAAARRVSGVRDVVRLDGAVAVVADHSWAAMAGREALRVTWDEGPLKSFDSDAFRARLATSSSGRGTVGRKVGDVDAALGAAARRMEAVYDYPFFVHAPLEPMNAVADARADGCEMWLGTQAPDAARDEVAAKLGLDAAAVKVHPQLIGGGFGRRLGVEHAVEAAALSKAIGGPVQVLWTRDDDMRHGYFQPAAVHRMIAGLDASGKLAGWWHREASSSQNYSSKYDPADPEIAAVHMWGGVDNPYVYPAMRAEFVHVESPIRLGPWRAVFAPSNVMARECFLDEIALATRQDPVALRLALLAAPDAADADQRRRRERLAAVIRLAAEKSGWGRGLAPGHGMGIAAHVYDGETVLAQVAEVSAPGGVPKVHRVVCAIDCGPVVNPLGLEAQVESAVVWGLSQTLHRAMDFKAGHVQAVNYSDYPILRLSETPAIETHIVEGATDPYGAGEQPVSTIGAAVLNALCAATGRRVRHLPVAPGDLGAGPARGKG